ncbi:MAG: DUF3857 domain-containing protein [Terriglobia bacterium]
MKTEQTFAGRRLVATAGLSVLAAVLALPGGLGAPDLPWEGEAFAADPAAVLEAASRVPVGDGLDIVVLLKEQTYVFDSKGQSIYTWRLVYRILSARGLERWSKTEMAWAPWYQEPPSIRARVITPDGNEHVLDPSTLGEFPELQADPDVYTDRRILRAPLPAVTVGAVVEEEVVLREKSVLFGPGGVQAVYFGEYFPVLQARLVIDAPASLPLHYVTRLLPAIPRREEKDGRVRLTFETGRLEPLEGIDFLRPSDEPQQPSVVFSTADSWATLAAAYAQVVDEQIDPDWTAGLVEGTLEGTETRQETLARLLARVQREVRYTGIEFGNAAIIPRTPAETLARKYGDCKDKATLLIAMLRSAGLDAYVALLRAGPGPDVEKGLPGVNHFNHAIVYIPGTPPVWIDPTVEFARVNQLPLADQGRLALVAGPETTGLVRIPATVPEDNRIVETREFFLSDSGKARVIETTEAWGSADLFYRDDYSQVSFEIIHRAIENYAAAMYLADEVTDLAYTDPHDLSQPFRIRFEAAGVKRAWTDVADAGVAILLPPLLDRLPDVLTAAPESSDTPGATPARRASDLVLFNPYVTEWQYRIVAPPGYRPRELPEAREEHFGPATFSQQFAVEEKGVVTATIRFDTGKRRLSPAEVAALREGIQELQNASVVLVTFEQLGEAHLAAGRIGEALREFRGLARQHPNEVRHRTQIARALLAGGMGEAARAEVRRAIELEPDSAVAHRTLAWILQHDLVGRRFKKGFDLEGALAAYRRALELDAEDLATRVDLAILLEHDAKGIRYSPEARLDEAITEYRGLLDELEPSNPLVNNLRVALLRARRFEELRDFMESHPGLPAHQAFVLVAVAALEGPDAALREAPQLFRDDERRRGALQTAGRLLAELRLYPEASALLTAGAKGDPNAVNLLARANLLSRTRRHEEITYPEDDPRGLAQEFMVALFLGGSGEAYLRLHSREFRELASKEDDAEGLEQALRGVRGMAQREGMVPEMIVDLALAGVEVSVDGDDSVGYRLRQRGMFPGAGSEEVLFVVREEEEFKILATARMLGLLGLRVLELAEAGDLAGARRWLDWAREERSLPGGDDPYAGPPFPRFWTRGSEAGVEEIRYAGASLLVETALADRALPILEAGREQAATEEERLRFDLALAGAFLRLERPADALPIARGLVESRPDSRAAFGLLVGALSQLSRWEEVEQAAQERLERLPDNPEALRTLANLAQQRDDYERADELHQRLAELGETTPGDLNNHAWQKLFEDKVTDEAIQEAQRAAMLTRNQASYILHTLASLYAEVGRTNEAREVLLNAMEVEAMEEPTPAFWYVFGRIAEQYGELEAAIAAYQKVTPPEEEAAFPLSTYRLAQRRLELLGAPGEEERSEEPVGTAE